MENQAEKNEQNQVDASVNANQERITPEKVNKLHNNEIFVFGSNLQGMHGGGAARIAFQRYGAIMGQGVGLQGKSYAIPTMQGDASTIKPYVEEFIDFATKIGCGIAGFTPKEIAPLFKKAVKVQNIYLPIEFWEELKQ